jgi:hypothetical protein
MTSDGLSHRKGLRKEEDVCFKVTSDYGSHISAEALDKPRLRDGSWTSAGLQPLVEVKCQFWEAPNSRRSSRTQSLTLTLPSPPPPSSCFNGGTCVDGISSFSCLCRPGYTGAHCQYEVDPCLSRPCLHGGVCSATHPGFRCACPEGFTGSQCQVGGATGHVGGAWGGSALHPEGRRADREGLPF